MNDKSLGNWYNRIRIYDHLLSHHFQMPCSGDHGAPPAEKREMCDVSAEQPQKCIVSLMKGLIYAVNIKMDKNGSELTVAVEGRLDTKTAPELEAQLDPALEGVEKLVFDFEKLSYISSAGLRVLLTSMQYMTPRGTMTVRNVNSAVMDILEVTGFTEELNIE